MSKFGCDKHTEGCVRCAECCNFSSRITLTPSQERLIKERLFEETGFLYIYPFTRFGIGIQSYEYGKAKKLSEKQGIKLKLLPKKMVYDKKTKKTIVFDWFMDHKICPFLKNKNECRIYAERFDLCRLFPETDKKTPKIEERLKKLGRLFSEGRIIPPKSKTYERLIELAKKAEKVNFEDFSER
jgi:Fe-S-cluster containining protein